MTRHEVAKRATLEETASGTSSNSFGKICKVPTLWEIDRERQALKTWNIME